MENHLFITEYNLHVNGGCSRSPPELMFDKARDLRRPTVWVEHPGAKRCGETGTLESRYIPVLDGFGWSTEPATSKTKFLVDQVDHLTFTQK